MRLGVALLLVGVALVTLVSEVKGHSWITCTDYLENNGRYWDGGKCRAFARHGWRFTKKHEFGRDWGYDYINPREHKACRTSRNDHEAYNTEYPMAIYFRGQTIVITHPTKNHVADIKCTNKYIPDKGNHVYISERNPSSDPTLSAFKRARFQFDLGEAPHGHHIPNERTFAYPKPGFQNAPAFCENMDKALATNHFVIPEGLEPGRYTFMWAWNFNQADDANLYTSCWEADVVNTRAERDQVLRQRGHSTITPKGIWEPGM